MADTVYDFNSLSSWSTKTYSWGTGKTRCYIRGNTSIADDMVTISVEGAVRCNTVYSLNEYGVKVTTGHNGGGGVDAASVSNTGVFYSTTKEDDTTTEDNTVTEGTESTEGDETTDSTVTTGGVGEDSENADEQWIAYTKTEFNFPRKTYEYDVTVYTKYVGEDVSVEIDGVKKTYEGCGNAGYISAKVTVPALEIFTISYDANGGSNAPDSQVKYYGKNLVLSNISPKRTGFAFLGWSSDADATAGEYSPSSEYIENADITFYAVWESANKLFMVMQSLNGYEIQDGGARNELTLFQEEVAAVNDGLMSATNNIEGNAASIDSIYSEITGLSDRIGILETAPESIPAVQALAQEAKNTAEDAKNKIDSHLAQIEEESKITRVEDDKLFAQNLSVEKNMYMGDWVFTNRSNGNLTLKWIGGDV